MTFDLSDLLPTFGEQSIQESTTNFPLPPPPPVPQKKEIQAGPLTVDLAKRASAHVSHLPPSHAVDKAQLPNIEEQIRKPNLKLLKKEIVTAFKSNDPNSPNAIRAMALLKQHFDPSMRMEFFSHSLEEGWDLIAEALIDQGVIDADEADAEGATPLHQAALFGKTQILEKLLESAFDVNAPDKNGLTPLHAACVQGHTDCALLLIEHGADLNAKDSLGKTPIAWALRYGKHDLLKAVLQKAKDKNLVVAIDSFFSTYCRLSPSERESFDHLGSFKEIVQLKRGGQIWGFNGPFNVGLLQAEFEGHDGEFLFPELYKAQRKFLELSPEDPLCTTLKDRIGEIQSSKDLSAEQLAQKVRSGETVMIHSSWNKHATFLVFSGDRVYKCNRGDGAEETSGVVVYEMTDNSRLEEIFRHLKATADQPEARTVFENEIDVTLGLIQLFRVPQKYQTVGNCTKASCNSAFFAVLLAEALKHHSRPVAIQMARKAYKEYTHSLRASGLQEQLRSPRPNIEFLKRVYHKLIDPVRLLAIAVADKVAMAGEITSRYPQVETVS